jgi:hypothetical protein
MRDPCTIHRTMTRPFHSTACAIIVIATSA